MLQPNNVQSVHLSKFLFSARSRMLDFEINFRKKYSDLNRPLGCDKADSQQHGLHYDKIVTNAVDEDMKTFSLTKLRNKLQLLQCKI